MVAHVCHSFFLNAGAFAFVLLSADVVCACSLPFAYVCLVSCVFALVCIVVGQ